MQRGRLQSIKLGEGCPDPEGLSLGVWVAWRVADRFLPGCSHTRAARTVSGAPADLPPMAAWWASSALTPAGSVIGGMRLGAGSPARPRRFLRPK